MSLGRGTTKFIYCPIKRREYVFCPQCGTESQKDFEYCPKCGLRLIAFKSLLSANPTPCLAPVGNNYSNVEGLKDTTDNITEDTISKQKCLKTENLQQIEFSIASCWARFFARVFDIWWETLLVYLVILIFADSLLERIMARPGSEYVFPILCLPVVFFFDAVFFGLNGNSIGKSFLGLKIIQNGKSLSFGQYLSRNFSIWFRAFAFGFPIISAFTLAYQGDRLRKGQLTSYDVNMSYNVLSEPIGWIRRIVFGVVFLIFFFTFSILNTSGLNSIKEIVSKQFAEKFPNKTSEDQIKNSSRNIAERETSNTKPNLNHFDFGELVVLSNDKEPHYIKIQVIVSYTGQLDQELNVRKGELRDSIAQILMKLPAMRAKEDFIDRYLQRDIETELNRLLANPSSGKQIIDVVIPTFLTN